MHYKLRLYDFRKMMKRVLYISFVFILYFPCIILLLPKNFVNEFFVVFLISGVSLFPLSIFIALKNVYFNETIELCADSLVSRKFGEVKFDDLEKISFNAYRGLSVRLKLKNGFILGISPYSEFKTHASKEFLEFYTELQSKKSNHV